MTDDRPRGLIAGSGRAGASRRLDQMISARLDPELVAELKRIAKERGLSFSDVLREAALRFLASERAENVIIFDVSVINETRPADALTRSSFKQEIPAAV